jgi:cell division protein FtsL
MLKKIIKTYTRLVDTKIENSTLVVLIIAAMIVSASILVNDTNTYLYTKSDILESQQIITLQNNIIEINGVKYKINLEEITK